MDSDFFQNPIMIPNSPHRKKFTAGAEENISAHAAFTSLKYYHRSVTWLAFAGLIRSYIGKLRGSPLHLSNNSCDFPGRPTIL
jgi:hypothetical protein